MIFATTMRALGAALTRLVINVESWFAVVVGSALLVMSLVPRCGSTMWGVGENDLAGGTQPVIPVTVIPSWPSWFLTKVLPDTVVGPFVSEPMNVTFWFAATISLNSAER